MNSFHFTCKIWPYYDKETLRKNIIYYSPVLQNICDEVMVWYDGIEETWLFFDTKFNEDLTSEIIDTIKKYKYVKFGPYFNKNIDELPQNIEKLFLGHHFNQKIDFLPTNLRYLGLSVFFRQKLNNLPDSLTHLTIEGYFNEEIDPLPKRIKYIEINGYFDKNMDYLLKNVEHIKIYNNFEERMRLYYEVAGRRIYV